MRSWLKTTWLRITHTRSRNGNLTLAILTSLRSVPKSTPRVVHEVSRVLVNIALVETCFSDRIVYTRVSVLRASIWRATTEQPDREANTNNGERSMSTLMHFQVCRAICYTGSKHFRVCSTTHIHTCTICDSEETPESTFWPAFIATWQVNR